MSKLKQILAVFTEASQPLSTQQIAIQLDLQPELVEDMIAFWVRKGKLRDVNECSDDCGTCGAGSAGCPFVINMPKRYECVIVEEPVGY